MEGLVRVEVPVLRPDGTARIRLWYHKWRGPVELEMRRYRQGSWLLAAGTICSNRKRGILREHLAEVAGLLRKMGLRCASYYSIGAKYGALRFSECFLRSLFERFGAAPFSVEPPQVEHLGGLSFKIGGYVADFSAKGGGGAYVAAVKAPYAGVAVWIAASLAAAGVKARPDRRSVVLDADSLIGLTIYTGAQPPGFTRLYASPRLYVFAEETGAQPHIYFAVKYGGVWRAVRGRYAAGGMSLYARERGLADALGRALGEELGLAEVPVRRRLGFWELALGPPQLSRFLQRAAEGVDAEPASIALEGGTLKVRGGGTEVSLEVGEGGGPAVWLGLSRTLRLYKALKLAGVPATLAPEGIRVGGEALWPMIAMAAGNAEPNTEIAPGILLASKHDVGGQALYAYVYASGGGVAIRLVLSGRGGWRGAGGFLRGNRVYLRGDVAVAEAINRLYQRMGAERSAAVRGGALVLKMRDLELLGIKRAVVRVLLDQLKAQVAPGSQLHAP